MSKRIAVIDLGTNTFHLLIVSIHPQNKTWEEIYRERVYIHLAEKGIETIGDEAFERGLKALHSFAEKCASLNITQIKACGTAALRTATNGAQFVKEVKDKLNISIETIDGLKEANYIASGVQLALPETKGSRLIMDIGGGSVEFILTEGSDLIWAKSFPIGVAVLKKSFHQEDPIGKKEIISLNKFLSETLEELQSLLHSKIEVDLVGASGTFDVLQNMLTPVTIGDNYAQLTLKEFEGFSNDLIQMNLADRKLFPNLPEQRSTLIVVALLLIKHVLTLHDFQNLFVSKYAVKEGILYSLAES